MKYTLLAEIAFVVFLFNAPVADAGATILGAKGNYGGLLQVPDADAARRPLASSNGRGVVRGHLPNEDPLNSGTLTAQVGESGHFTALLNWKGFRYSFKGAFDPTTLTSERDLADRGNPGEILALKLVLHPAIPPTDSTPLISGSIHCELMALGVIVDDPATPEVEELRTFYTAEGDLSGAEPDSEAAQVFAGSLNTSFIDPPDYGSLPQDIGGDGFTITRVSKRRGFAARIAGRLPDYEPFSAGSLLRGTNYTIFAGLYSKDGRFGGSTIGQLSVADRISLQSINLQNPLQDKLFWRRNEDKDSEYYGKGFETGYGIKTLVYLISRLGGGKQIPQISIKPGPVNATLSFKEGNLGKELNGEDVTLTVTITITPFGVKVLEPNPQRVSLRTNALAATWNGKFDHPVSGLRIPFHGAFLQARPPTNGEAGKNGEGRGCFKGSLPPETGGFLESGSVRMVVE
jgi:hypothetical protein